MVLPRATFEDAYLQFLTQGYKPDEAAALANIDELEAEALFEQWQRGQAFQQAYRANPAMSPLEAAGFLGQVAVAPVSLAGSAGGAFIGEQLGGRTGATIGEIAGGIPFAAVSTTPRAIGQTAATALPRTITPTLGEQAGRAVGQAVAPVRRAAGEVMGNIGGALERTGVPSPVSVADATTIPPTGAAGAGLPPPAPATVTRVPNREELRFLRGQVTQRLGSVRSEIADAAKAGDQPRLASLRQQMLGLEAQRNDIRAGKYLLTVDPNDPAERLATAIERAGVARESTDVMRSRALSQRVGRAISASRDVPSTQKGQAFRTQLAGQLPKQGFEPVADQFTPDDVANLFDRIWDDASPLRPFEKLNADEALKAILDPAAGATPRTFELELLERVFGPRLSAAFLSRRSGWSKWGPEVLDLLNVPKTIRSAYDASAPLRQGVFLLPSHVKESVGNLKNMVRAMASERASDDIYESIVLDPYYSRLVTQGRLHIIDPVRRGLAQGMTDREEFFFSRLAGRIPGVGASERGYVTYLNKLRFDVAKRTLQNWERAGISLDDAGAEIGRMTSFLNKATGRGSFGRAENIVPYMSAMFWSPRLAISRFQVPVEVFTQLARGIRGSAADRLLAKQMATELAAFVGTGATILTIIDKMGMGDVELDPRSSDFGKIRVGGISIDFWGGFQQVARYTAQVASGERKPITITNQKDYIQTKRLVKPGQPVPTERQKWTETFGRYVWSKLSPGLPSVVAGEAARQTFIGEDLGDKQKLPFSFGYGPDVSVRMNQYIEQFIPLFELQLADAITQEGWRTGVAATAPVGLGVGTDIQPIMTTKQVPKESEKPYVPPYIIDTYSGPVQKGGTGGAPKKPGIRWGP